MTKKKITQFILTGLILSFTLACKKENNDDETNLFVLLALASNTGFVSVNYGDGFTAFRTAEAAGKPERKENIDGLERKTSMEITFNFTSTNGEIRLFGSVDQNLRFDSSNKNAYISIKPTSLTSSVIGTTNPNTTQAGGANFVPGLNSTTYCFDIHREVESVTEVKYHLIGWPKACASLTNADRQSTGYVLNFESDAYENASSKLANAALTEIYGGYAFKDAAVSSIRFNTPLALGGSFK
jgi:hypothetical protein